MAADHKDIKESTLNIFEGFNIVFYFIFLMEMVVKLVGQGLRSYFLDKFNAFDALIVAISSLDIVIYYSTSSRRAGAITALRAFRLLRVFKLAKSWLKF